MTRERVLAMLFAATALLHLLPIWRVHYVPTVDGPAHVYNAVVMRELGAGTPQMARVFRIDARPSPNWMSHALLRLALVIAPPLVAEKLVLSIVVLLFLGGCWTLAGSVDRGSRFYAFLAMPLAFSLLLAMGSYNFMLATALMMFAIATWWRARSAILLAALLLLAYFAHPIPTAVALLLIALGTLVLRRRLLPIIAALTPAALLIAWFALQPSAQAGSWTWKGAMMWQPLTRMLLLLTMDLRQLTFGTILGILFGALIVITFVIERIGRERDVFLLFTAVAVALYLAAPLGMNGDLLLKARFLLFPYLLLLPWLTPRFGKLPAAMLFALVAAANVFFLRDAWKRNDKVIAAAIAPLSITKPLHTIVALVFDRSSPHATVALLSHAASYAAAERKLVDLGNYEAGTGYFPIAFREGVARPDIFALESAPHDFDPSATSPDYIYTWKMPAGSAIESRLLAQYDLAASEGEARVYRHR